MAAEYYAADAENGDHIDDPSEDALYMLIDELSQPDNTYVTITPADGSDWYASVSLVEEGGYEVERRDPRWRDHDLNNATDTSRIAMDLTIWLAARSYPDRPQTRLRDEGC
jgi:hypothetical protein